MSSEDIFSQKPLNGINMLIAEDIETALLVLSTFMKQFGANVITVENGEEAYKACKTQFFDIVLMDIQMPVMDGIEATKLINQSCKSGKIIAITAASEVESQELLTQGFSAIHNKPINAKSLCKLIQKLIH